jgi:hypothetical protein
MLAHHPISGKPIRIIKTETHLHKNNKTMVWLRESPDKFKEPHRFQRWHTVVNSIEQVKSWKKCFGNNPSVIILTSATEHTKNWLIKDAPRSGQLLFLSRAVMNLMELKWFSEQKFINIVCLEELSQLFPHITKSYTADMADQMLVTMIALVIRVRKLLGITKEELETYEMRSAILEIKNQYQIDFEDIREPPPLYLIQQFYEAEKAKRAREYKKCLEKNLECAFVDKIILLNEQDFSGKLPKNTKLQQHILGHRMKYSDVIRHIKENIPENSLVVFANLDIYLDDSWKDIWSINMEDVFISLLRYEDSVGDEEPKLFGPRPDSQDTWVVNSSSIKNREWDYTTLDFEFGKSGCDNAINIEMLKKKFVVANPALSLRTIHCHSSQIRTYNPEDVVDKPIFMYLDPTGLHDLQVVSNLKKYETFSSKPKVFSRKINSIDEKTLNTFSKMASRDEKILLSADSENLFLQNESEKTYSFNNTFVTTNGLVYDYDKLFVGPGSLMRELWANTIISNMTASIGVQKILATPLSNEVANDTWSYITQYMSKIFYLNSLGYKGDMWMSRENKKIQEFLQFFKWEDEVMPVLPRDNELVGFGKSVTFLESRGSGLVSTEEMEALRMRLKSYEKSVIHPKRVVIFQDDDILSSEDVLMIEDELERNGYEVNVIYPSRSSPSFILQRVSGVKFCISAPRQERLFWLLPKDAHVIDIMSELNISGEGAHYAGACSLNYWVNLVPKMKTDIRRKFLCERVLANLQQIENKREEVPKNVERRSKQKIVMPIGQTGFHAHSGDSFREMVGIWAERGLVEIEESNKTSYVWWGEQGDTILYDRANFDWIRKTPENYNKILCGNPHASEIKGGIQWSFWPRRPRLLESQLSNGVLGYEDRTRGLVFYGRIENSVQKEHRTNDLYKACDEFDMPIGANQPYKYTQREYLEKLSKSKYGLCLAGFGPKCNREIECMALGTVPVVAPDVDMENYYNPPKEGVHFIRLKTFDPEEAKKAISEISEEKWKSMSLAAHEWWKENCSPDGLFLLTKALVN